MTRYGEEKVMMALSKKRPSNEKFINDLPRLIAVAHDQLEKTNNFPSLNNN